MKSEAKSSAIVTLSLLECLKAYGLSPVQIKEKTGVDEIDYQSPDVEIPVKKLIKLWQVATEVTGDPALPLHLNKRFGKNLTHFLYCIAINSKNGFEAIQHWCRYSSLHSEINRVSVEIEDEAVTINFFLAVPELQNRWMHEYPFVQFVQYARQLLGSQYKPIEVRFQHQCPDKEEPYRSFFQCPVYFEQEMNSLTIDKEPLYIEFEQSNQHLQTVLIKKAESDLKNLETNHSLKKQVVEHIIEGLPKGNLTVETICGNLNMSRATLHRHLKEAGTSYKELLTNVRKKLAQSYIEQEMSSSQMAYLLGYSNTSNFVNAFRRWFDANPKQAKKSS